MHEQIGTIILNLANLQLCSMFICIQNGKRNQPSGISPTKNGIECSKNHFTVFDDILLKLYRGNSLN